MLRPSPFAPVVSGAVYFAFALAPHTAAAQAPPLSESVVIGGWTFRPSLQLRTRGEYRRYPIDTGGDVYSSNAVLAEGFGAALPPIVDTADAVENQWFLTQRTRLGITVDHGPLTGVLTLQDARLWGADDAIFLGAGKPTLPETAPHEAYLDIHTRSGRRAFARLGRQRVAWGDGRLVGDNDWSFTGRSLDGVRAGVQLGDFDLEAMAVLLAAPGGTPPAISGTRKPIARGTGAQLFGLDAVWHLIPLLNVELTALARIVREPRPTWLTPGDTVVLDARLFGDRRGFRYAVEGAYELGRVSTFAADRTLGALALAARAELETALPGGLTFSARGAYATGDDSPLKANQTQHRFDPILPDEHENYGAMGLYTWSNLIEASGGVSVRPLDTLTLAARYEIVGLASPSGRWVTASLVPVGAATENDAHLLGHEVDATVSVQPWEPLRLELGYGAFLFGNAAKAILEQASRAVANGRAASMQHWVFLQATLTAP